MNLPVEILPQAKGVYDVDSVGLLKIISAFNRGYDYNGNKLDSPTEFCAGTTANPNDLRDEALEKLKVKIEAGQNLFKHNRFMMRKFYLSLLKRLKFQCTTFDRHITS